MASFHPTPAEQAAAERAASIEAPVVKPDDLVGRAFDIQIDEEVGRCNLCAEPIDWPGMYVEATFPDGDVKPYHLECWGDSPLEDGEE